MAQSFHHLEDFYLNFSSYIFEVILADSKPSNEFSLQLLARNDTGGSSGKIVRIVLVNMSLGSKMAEELGKKSQV